MQFLYLHLYPVNLCIDIFTFDYTFFIATILKSASWKIRVDRVNIFVPTLTTIFIMEYLQTAPPVLFRGRKFMGLAFVDVRTILSFNRWHIWVFTRQFYFLFQVCIFRFQWSLVSYILIRSVIWIVFLQAWKWRPLFESCIAKTFILVVSTNITMDWLSIFPLLFIINWVQYVLNLIID